MLKELMAGIQVAHSPPRSLSHLTQLVSTPPIHYLQLQGMVAFHSMSPPKKRGISRRECQTVTLFPFFLCPYFFFFLLSFTLPASLLGRRVFPAHCVLHSSFAFAVSVGQFEGHP